MDLLDLHARWPQRYPALLESAARAGAGRVSAQGRYDILFAFPQEALWKDPCGRLHGAAAAVAPGFFAALDAAWSAQRPPAGDASSPFSGGWLVFLGYEMAEEAEPALRLPASPDAVVALALRVPAAVVWDHHERTLQVVTEPGWESLREPIEADITRAARGEDNHRAAQAAQCRVRDVKEEAPARFLDAVRRAQDFIRAGEIYQANLSRLWRAELAPGLPPAELYRRLRAANPAPFAGSLQWGALTLLSSSPERLCALRGGQISTRPIAGTRPRSGRPGADPAEIAGLIAHPKERAEHIMLIDLERNDLGRVCEPGSVRVDEFMALESYEHVHHIVSNVRGRLRAGLAPGQVLRALFPGGTITGCPKVRCMQIIAELEGVGRGGYTGALGYLNRDGSGDFNILIRTMVLQGRTLTFRAGAGIVADSDPARELAETRAKAAGLLHALGVA